MRIIQDALKPQSLTTLLVRVITARQEYSQSVFHTCSEVCQTSLATPTLGSHTQEPSPTTLSLTGCFGLDQSDPILNLTTLDTELPRYLGEMHCLLGAWGDRHSGTISIMEDSGSQIGSANCHTCAPCPLGLEKGVGRDRRVWEGRKGDWPGPDTMFLSGPSQEQPRRS